uniref:Nucleolar protein 9 n=1 Tax=Pogona vitticeps TaxID=103695 RepID=A0ABM5EJ69_9SAUR
MGVPSHPRKRGKNRKGQKKQTSPSRSAQGGASKESKGVSFPKLEPPSADYFRQAHETLKSGFDSDEEKDLFISNVLEEAKGVALPLALDKAGSLLLQALIPSASSSSLCCLLRGLIPSLRLAACHPCGAHILEAILLRAPLLIKDGAEDSEMLGDLVLELGRAVEGEFSAFVSDVHASFVVRTLLQVLGGVRVGSDGGRALPGLGISPSRARHTKPESDGPTEFEVPDTFLSLLHEFSECFQEHISDFITNKFFSLCLQVALEVLHRKLPQDCSDLSRSVIGYLSSCNPAAGQSTLLVFLKDATCSRVLDKVLEVSDRKALLSFYKAHVKGQLQVLAVHKVANFTLQRLIRAASPKLLANLLEELSPGVEAIMAHEHLGVITALLGACRKHGAHQQEVVRILLEAFHCWEPASRQLACVPLIASVLAYEVYYGEEAEDDPSQSKADLSRPLSSVSYHGSLLLQHLLHFADPSVVLQSMASMTPEDLVTLACDPAGSHVYDALLASPSVPEKQRRKILRLLKGRYVSLACNKHGSRVLDAMWGRATLPAKREMAQELAEQEPQLRHDPFGHHVARNFALTHFLKRRRDWEHHQEAEKKRKDLFAEILEG